MKTLLCLYVAFAAYGGGVSVSTQVIPLDTPAACSSAGEAFKQMVGKHEAISVDYRCIPS